MRHFAIWCAALILFGVELSSALGAATEALPDTHIEGYALSILEQQFNMPSGSVTVRKGVMTVILPHIGNAQRARVTEALRHIRGVKRVIVITDERSTTTAVAPETTAAVVQEAESHWFPRGQLFEPLHADPRWPHFAATVRSYSSGGEGNVETGFAGDFGETLPIYRGGTASHRWDVGVQAGVFSLFDLPRDKHLLNADYIVAAMGTYRAGDFSALLRYFHQSSHLGDEFLVYNRGPRRNISYEMVDGKLSYDIGEYIRLYGGAGVLVRQDPASLGRVRTQYGIEVKSPFTSLGAIRPVAYADFQSVQQDGTESQWITNVSLRAGVQFEKMRLMDHPIQLLAEYYSGRSPNGQFYVQRIETIGLGVHVYF